MNMISLAVDAGALWGKAWPILIAVLFFGLIIIFHELGHFLFAKLFKVQVNEFSIGMGPAIIKFKKGETKYSLRLLPIGGFVSMEGEDSESESDRAFYKQKAWKRFIVIAAGGVVNLIMGVIIVAVMLGTSDDLIGTPQVHSFEKDSLTAQSGLEEMDIIKKVNGKNVICFTDLKYMLSSETDGEFDFVVERNGEKVTLNNVKFATQEIDGRNYTVCDFVFVGVEPNFINVAKYSVLESVATAKVVWMSLFDLVTGQYGFNDLSGPIGTVSYIADAAETAKTETDFGYLLNLMAIIAINIGLFNLLPVPALDGGRLLFLLIEIIFRKPVPRKYEGWVHAAGLVLLMLLMVVISFNDILKLIRG